MKLAELLQAIENDVVIKIDSRELDITLDDAALSKIAEKLYKNKSITDIHIESDAVSEKGVAALCDSLKTHEQILSLSLSGIKEVSIWMGHLVEMLKSNKTIQILKLNNNQIDDTTLTPLSKTVSIIFSLKTIYLENNLITDKSVDDLIHALKFGHQISLLSLKGNKITDKGAKIFADYLSMIQIKSQIPFQFDPYITQLLLDNNLITDAGIELFATSLNGNRFLLSLGNLGNPYSEQSKTSLEKINTKLSENNLFSQQFMSIDNFKKIGQKPGGSESPGGVYLKQDDKTKWLIKFTYGNGTLGERIGTIQEYCAIKITQLMIEDYPSALLILDGGQFKVAYQYIDNLEDNCNKFDTQKFIKNLFESYLMCYVIGDADTEGNRWFYEKLDNIIFYKGDLGMAFYFNQDNIIKRIDIDAISNAQIAKAFGLSREFVDRVLNNETKIKILEKFLDKITSQQIYKNTEEMKLFGKHGDENIKILCQRVEDCRLTIPGLIKQLKNPNKIAQFIQIPKEAKNPTDMKQEESNQFQLFQ